MLKTKHVQMIEKRVAELNNTLQIFNKIDDKDLVNQLNNFVAKQVEFLNKLKTLNLSGGAIITRCHYKTDGYKFLDCEDNKVFEIGEGNLTFNVEVYGDTLFGGISITNDYTGKSVCMFDDSVEKELVEYHSIGGDALLELVINKVTPNAKFVEMSSLNVV